MAERARLILEADSSQMSTAEKQLEKLVGAGKRTEESAKSLAAQISKMEADYKRSAAIIGLNKSQIELYDAAMKGATKSELQQIAAIQQKNAALKKSAPAFKIAKNSSQQLGFQIQDIAVQLQGGQSPFLVLSQQGSQLASILGPSGALFGAVIAISGAIAGSLLPSLFDSAESTEDYIDKIGRLTDGFKEVTEAQKIYIEQQKAIEREEIEDRIAGIRDRIEEMKRAISGAATVMPDLVNADEMAIFEEATESASRELVKLNSDLAIGQQELKQLAKFLDIVSGKREREKERIKAQKDETKALIRAINRAAREEIALLNEQESARLRAIETVDRYSLGVLTGSERIIETYNRQKDAVREAIEDNAAVQERGAQLIIDIEKRKQEELARIRDREMERQKAANDAQFNQISGLFGRISGLASSENRKLFEIGKAAAIANATIKGIQSGINAYEYGTRIGGPITGAGFAAISAAFTGAQIGAIESQSPPRAQGGQMLPNRSYRVGEFGPEIVTTGGSGGFVTQPNDAQVAAPVNIVVNAVNNSANSEISSEVRQINDRDFVVDVMVEQLTDSRSRSRRGLQSTSNVQARA